MEEECYFCRGIVSPHESGDLLLHSHGDHRVSMHRRCAVGHDLIDESGGAVEVTCPECGTVKGL